jgi:hypothetical protein
MTPAQRRLAASLAAELNRMAGYDDESVAHAHWVRQRYECCFPSYAPARAVTVRCAWHEAGHAVAAMTVGARFSSASIHHGRDSEGRVHRISGGGELAFVVDAAGQIGERLRDWSLLTDDGALRAWLASWRRDGGDARRFRQAIKARFGTDEVAAWRHSEKLLTPLRPQVRHVARALLMHPRPLPYPVVTELWAG